MKHKFIARVGKIYTGSVEFPIAGYGNRKVVLDSFEFFNSVDFNRDHFSVFPQDWINNAMSDDFFSVVSEKDYVEFSADLITYTRKDGSMEVKFANLEAV